MLDLKKPLKEMPEKYPKFSKLKGVSNTIVIGSVIYKVYCHLRDNPGKAFIASDVFTDLKEKRFKTVVDALSILSKRGYVYCLNFKIPIGRFGSYLYSYSQKALYKRLWSMTPETVKKSLAIVNQSLDMIYCIQDLCDLTGMKRNEVVSWIYRIYQRFDFFKIKREGKLRTFIFNKNITEERYKILFQKYYSTRIIKEKSIHTISGHDFEEFSTWAFIEYLKLKGIQLELTKVDKEPVDYIARMRLDISDLLGNNKHNNIVLTQFIISCKNYRLDRPLGSWYVLGLSGCLREGKTFRGETIFEPRNTVGIIFCTKASSYAYDMCGELGIRIIDLHKLLRMHEIVKAFTNNGHPLYDKIVSRIKMSREIKKASGVVKDG